MKHHRVPTHELLQPLRIHPTEFESITPWRFKPKWSPGFPIHIPVTTARALEETDMIQSEAMVYLDGSGQDGQIRAVAVLYRNGVE